MFGGFFRNIFTISTLNAIFTKKLTTILLLDVVFLICLPIAMFYISPLIVCLCIWLPILLTGIGVGGYAIYEDQRNIRKDIYDLA